VIALEDTHQNLSIGIGLTERRHASSTVLAVFPTTPKALLTETCHN